MITHPNTLHFKTFVFINYKKQPTLFETTKILGTGKQGVVYEITHKDDKFALKNTTVPYADNVEFCQTFANKQKFGFMKLHEETQYGYVYSCVDGMASDLLNKLSTAEWLSLLIQLQYIMDRMHAANYCHNDLHPNNLGYVETKKKYLLINDVYVKTHGKQYTAIDYGSISDANKHKVDVENQCLIRYLAKVPYKEFPKVINKSILKKCKNTQMMNLNKSLCITS